MAAARAARERMRVQLAAEQGDGTIFGPGDNLGGAVATFLDELARGFEPKRRACTLSSPGGAGWTA
jgi:hypothetical protein